MNTWLQSTIALLSLSASLPAQGYHYYDLAQERGPAEVQFSVGTLLGALEGDDRFHVEGDLGLEVPSAIEPFGTGRLMTASTGVLKMVEPEVHGWIDNPIPGFPNLVDVYFRDAESYFDSAPFAVDPITGGFSGGATITFSAGEIEVDALSTSSTFPLAGSGSDVFPITGSLNQFGGKVEFSGSFDYQFVGDVGGFSLAVTLNGSLYGESMIPGLSPLLITSNLVVGQPASFDFSGGLANEPIYLGASIVGLGQTAIPHLHVVADLLHPLPVNSGMTDASGSCTWTMQVPNRPGLSVWFQSIQLGLKSPPVASTIQ
ncbi:MAG: hypothetical protein QGH51_01540 [Planctomycetota bacterium]|jgi:hypothetical protein|nr:hypothetical protein [Planctomycetota bacterium]MDP6940684.1 hypothetical protein [Planctomycetota bacterium]